MKLSINKLYHAGFFHHINSLIKSYDFFVIKEISDTHWLVLDFFGLSDVYFVDYYGTEFVDFYHQYEPELPNGEPHLVCRSEHIVEL